MEQEGGENVNTNNMIVSPDALLVDLTGDDDKGPSLCYQKF